jgi:hypothetical protein
MVVTIKNKDLHKKIFKEINKFEDKAILYYKKGDIKKGKTFEKKADKLYDNNYNKMFEVKRSKN